MDSTKRLPIFPLELVDIVIDQLRNHGPSLKACALVSHDWLPRSLFHLFDTISCYQISPPGRTVDDWTRWSQESPKSALNVKTLVIRSHSTRRVLAPISALSIATLVSHLPNVQHLALSWLIVTGTPSHLPYGALPSLKSVTIDTCRPSEESFSPLFALISACPTVGTLKFKRVIPMKEPHIDQLPPFTSIPRIHRLHILSLAAQEYGYTHILPFLMGPPKLQLRSLHIAVASIPHKRSSLDAILSRCSETLHIVIIDVMASYWCLDAISRHSECKPSPAGA